MKTWQVYNVDGYVVGSVTAENTASACKKAREGYCDFPALVELPKEIAITIQKVVEEKTALELFIAGMIEEHIERFEKNTSVPVRNIEVKMLEKDPDSMYTIFVDVELDLNNIN